MTELLDKLDLSTTVSTDSRSICAGDIYLALVGERFDGHSFVFDALERGASRVISALSIEDLVQLKQKTSPAFLLGNFLNSYKLSEAELESKIIKVDDTLKAYHEIAQTYRRQVNPLVIAITGSSGKTTTKEMLRLVLGQRFAVRETASGFAYQGLHYSKANFNNEIGVPQTILSMPPDTEILILEMGMRGLGEIELLSKTAEPNIAVITNIGVAHIERLGSRDKIKQAKLEIVQGLKDYKQDTAESEKKVQQDHEREVGVFSRVLCEDVEASLFVDQSLYEELRLKPDDFEAIDLYSFDSSPHYKIQGLMSAGIHADANAVAAVTAFLGFEDAEIRRGLELYKPGAGRGQMLKDKNGNTWIDMSYNANPDSLRTNIDAMLQQFPERQKIVVLGELAESSDDLIHEVENHLLGIEGLKVLDARARDFQEFCKDLELVLKNSNEATILLQGSRVSQLERVLEHFGLKT